MPLRGPWKRQKFLLCFVPNMYTKSSGDLPEEGNFLYFKQNFKLQCIPSACSLLNLSGIQRDLELFSQNKLTLAFPLYQFLCLKVIFHGPNEVHLTFFCELKPFLLSWSVFTPYRTCDYFLFVIQLRGHHKDTDHTRMKGKISPTVDSHHSLGKIWNIILPEFSLSMSSKSQLSCL